MILATLCYVKKDGKTLMLHRVKKKDDIHEGKWNGLGGKLHPGETPEECVIREVWEESGLSIEKPILKGILTFPGFAREQDWYVYVFTAVKFKGELIDSPEGNLEWIDDHDLPQLNLWEGDKTFMTWFESDAFFSGKFVYVNGTLIDHDVVFYENGKLKETKNV